MGIIEHDLVLVTVKLISLPEWKLIEEVHSLEGLSRLVLTFGQVSKNCQIDNPSSQFLSNVPNSPTLRPRHDTGFL